MNSNTICFRDCDLREVFAKVIRVYTYIDAESSNSVYIRACTKHR